MMEDGLLEEVKSLGKLNIPRTATSMQSLGYREIYGYLDGDYDLERAVYLIKLNTRHFAKRQLTWFRWQVKSSEIDLDTCPNPLELIAASCER